MSIIVNVEFLLVLSTVFTEAFAEASPQGSESVTEVLGEARVVTTDLASSSTAPPTAANQSPVLQLTLQIEEPEIFLLADAKQKNTNALIVKVGKIFSRGKVSVVTLNQEMIFTNS
jgi:hypothetical protein